MVASSPRSNMPGNQVTELPEAVHELPEWQAAMEALLLVAEPDGPSMFARIHAVCRSCGVQTVEGSGG